MSVSKELRDVFRARDEQGNEWEVKVQVEVMRGPLYGSLDGFASGEAVAVSGPAKGMSGPVDFESGDVYRVHLIVGPIRITRIR